MRKIERRMRVLEAQFPQPEEPSEFLQLLPFMSLMEMLRLLQGMQSGLKGTVEFEGDVRFIVSRARERRNEGWSRYEMDILNDQEKAKMHGQGRLLTLFSNRHWGLNPYPQRFDALDLALEEIDELVATVDRATCAADFTDVHHLIERLRIDGCRVGLDKFAAIMLEGQLPREVTRLMG